MLGAGAGEGPDLAGPRWPREATQTHRLEGAWISVRVPLVDLSSFALLPKKVFPPSMGAREGGEGSLGTPAWRLVPGTSAPLTAALDFLI